MTSRGFAGRLPAVDIARGVAILGMFGYHLTWDLAHFGFIDARAPFAPSFRLYSHVVAVTFVALAGASLVLARRAPFDWRRWALHFGTIVVAAGVVTVASWFLFPEGLIFFGILHCIAAAILVATPFLFAPWWCALVMSAVVAGLPLFVQSPAFDAPLLQWTGLGLYEPSSNDLRTFFPWAAPAFAGVGLMLFGRPRGFVEWLARWQPRDILSRTLSFGGRHSLAIYLIHQPLFFGALSALAMIVPASSPADQVFLGKCGDQCLVAGAPKAICERTCACAAREMKTLNLWDKMVANALDDAEKLILSSVAQQCLKRLE